MLIFCSYILNDNDKMIYYYKVSNSLNGRKFEFLSQLDLYVLKNC